MDNPYSYVITDRQRVYRTDSITATCISLYPLLSDPYEDYRVEVKKSRIEGAGEGLYAKVRHGTKLYILFSIFYIKPTSNYQKVSYLSSLFLCGTKNRPGRAQIALNLLFVCFFLNSTLPFFVLIFNFFHFNFLNSTQISKIDGFPVQN